MKNVGVYSDNADVPRKSDVDAKAASDHHHDAAYAPIAHAGSAASSAHTGLADSAGVTVANLHGRGTTANKPGAETVPAGTLYFDTTLAKLQRSTGSAWEDCEGAGGGGGGTWGSITGTLGDQTDLNNALGGKAAAGNVPVDTHAATSKATPVDGDELPLVDTEASNVLKKLTWANLKATLKTYLDALYAAVSHAMTAHTIFAANKVVGKGDAEGIDDYVVLVLPFDDSYNDVSGNSRHATGSGTSFVADVPAGVSGITKSLDFDGSSDYATVDDFPDADAGTSDFSVEMYVYADALGTYQMIVEHHSGSSNDRWSLMVADDGGTKKLKFILIDGSNYRFQDWATSAFPAEEWVHVAIEKIGTNYYMYQNGTVVFSGSYAGTWANYTSALTFGKQFNNAIYFDGRMCMVRISKGAARGNGTTFPVPNSKFGVSTVAEYAWTALTRTLLSRATAALIRADLDLEPGTDVPALAHTHGGTTNGSKLAQANTHESPDTDTATTSLHHTIGSGANNAAAGNHTHAAYIADPATPEQGDVLYWTGSAWARLAHGTSGQYLKTGGHAANPSWDTPAGGSASRWTTVTGYTATPASTSTLTMTEDKTATLLVGLPVRYTISSVVYYGQVTAIASNLLTIRGAPLGGDVTLLEVGTAELVRTVHMAVNGAFADADNTALLASDLKDWPVWELGKAYCVGFRHKEGTADSGANQPQCNVRIAGADVSTSNSNDGPNLSETQASTGIDINASNYDINYGEAIELEVDAGSNGNALDLTVEAVFVLA